MGLTSSAHFSNLYAKSGIIMEEETRNTQRAVAIFIINAHGELLLHKKTLGLGAATKQYVWETPYIVQQDSLISPQEEAERYLGALGIDCQLYEAFTVNGISRLDTSALHGGNHILIALAAEKAFERFASHNEFCISSINHVLIDAHDHPANYAAWFRITLEGVALYLKDLLSQKASPATHNLHKTLQ
jgi:hypothetical protein